MSLEAERYRNEYIFVLYNNEFRKIALSDIMWIEASRSYCNIHLVEGESGGTILLSTPLLKVYKCLPTEHFKRINRSVVINLKYVNAIRGNSVVINSSQFLISSSYRKIIFSSFAFIGTKKKLY